MIYLVEIRKQISDLIQLKLNMLEGGTGNELNIPVSLQKALLPWAKNLKEEARELVDLLERK